MFALSRAAAERAINPAANQKGPGLPTAVDNSALSYFPPIGSQGIQGSCTAWATGYYFSSYTQAMDEGYAASDGAPGHLCSPGFLYPLTNNGSDNGAVEQEVLTALCDVGCATLADTPWSDQDSTTWPTETAWVNALRNRTLVPVYLDLGDITTLKQVLANGQLGILTLTVYTNWYYNYPDNYTGIDSGVVYANSGSVDGGHAIAIVGYDDNKPYVDSRDGLTHHGAFLIANSWGPWWGVGNTVGAGGYMWIAYSFMQDPSFVDDIGSSGVYSLTDRPNIGPRCGR